MRGSLAALMLALILPLPALAGQVTVKPGETLSEIADRYGISVNRLMSLNGLQRANHVEAGTVLQVPGSGGGSRSASAGSAGRSGGSSITVQRGQTLSEIAEQQGISLTTLMRINGISDPDQVVAGQQLRLPGRSSVAASGSSANAYPRGASVHVVRPGESLSGIASAYGVPMNRLVALNGISDPDHVEPGTRLKLKGSTPVASQAGKPPATSSKGNGASVASAAPARPRATSATTTASITAPSTGKPARTPAAAATSATATGTTTHANHSGNTPITPATATSTTGTTSVTTAGTTAAATATTAVNRAPVSSQRPQSATTSPAVQTGVATGSTTLNSQAKATAPNNTASATTAITAATTTAANAPRPSVRPVTGAGATRSSTTVATARADWRTYGPLQVNWSAWQPMGGSMVAPSLNAKGQTFYTAINCGARKLNATTVSGEWQTWSDPSAEYEQQLLSDYCRSRS